MKRFAIPVLLAAIAAVQLIRIERVAAEASGPSPAVTAADNIPEAPIAAATDDELLTADDATGDAPAAPPMSVAEFMRQPPQPRAVSPEERVRAKAQRAAAAGNYDEEFAILSGLPYSIDPPDVLSIVLVGSAGGDLIVESDSGREVTGKMVRLECVVAMDGKINLKAAGIEERCLVAGCTLPEASVALHKELKKSRRIKNLAGVSVEVVANNSKVAYVVDQAGKLGSVVRVPVPYPLDRAFNVGAAIARTGPREFPLTAAKLAIHRPAPMGVGAELVIPVVWNEHAGMPTADTNYALLPGDRLFVTAPEPAGAAAAEPQAAASVDIEYAWNGASGLQKSYASSELGKADTVGKLMARMLSWEHRLHGSMLDQVAGIPEEFSGAEILIRRPADFARNEEEKSSSRWDDAAGRIVAGDDIELKAGDKLFVKLLDVKVSAEPIPEGVDTILIALKLGAGRRESGRLVPFEAGLTVADAIAATTLPGPIDFAKANIVHFRPEEGFTESWQGKLQSIAWDAPEGTPNKDYELQANDVIRVDPSGTPFNPPPRPVSELPVTEYPVGPASPAQANSGYYRPADAMPATAGASAPPIPVVGPQRAFPAVPASPRPAETPDGKSWAGYVVAWDAGSGPQSWNSHEELQKGDTVGSFVNRLIKRGHLRMLDIPEVDLSTAAVCLKRERIRASDSQSWYVPWDKATGEPANGEDRALEANDFIIIGLNGLKPGSDDSVTVVLKLEGGRESKQRVPFKPGLYVADLVAATILPNPMDFGKARMLLFYPGRPNPYSGANYPITWDGGKPTNNYAVLAGSTLTIDFNAAPLPPGANVESANAYSRPMPPPAATGPPAGPRAVEYKLALVEDTSGDLAEFVPRDSGGFVIRDSTALLPALRVLAKHKLVKTLSDPRIRTEFDRPAQFALGTPAEEGERDFAATHVVKIVGRQLGHDPEGRTLVVEVDARATHEGQKLTRRCELAMGEGENGAVGASGRDHARGRHAVSGGDAGVDRLRTAVRGGTLICADWR